MARAYPGLGLDTAPTRPWARRFSFRNGGGLVDAPGRRGEGEVQKPSVSPLSSFVRSDFERLLALDFDNLISGHGTPKLGGAKAALARNVERLPR
jgi:hypothetical protein